MTMAISKAILLLTLLLNLFVGLHGTVAEDASRARVASSEESMLAQISYKDLFHLFGNILDSDEKDLVGILEKNHHKLAPLLRTIEEAFGKGALGFLEVTGLPPKLVALRKKLLFGASELANLPSEELAALEKPELGYSIGWSHGRESFKVMDETENNTSAAKRRYDTAKGSFYMNPYADESIQNVYPPSLQPYLEKDLLQMTRFMSKVGLWIAVLCDLYIVDAATRNQCSLQQECPSQNTERVGDMDFEASISNNQWMVYKSLKSGKPAAKARLLYYFPQQQQQQQQASAQTSSDTVFDDWCGWHTDHGALTALLPGMLTGENLEQPQNQQQGPKPGLYIQTKVATDDPITKDRLVHVDLAHDSLGFQLGETLEILSRGKFEATPHAVKAPPASSLSIGRASLAVFLQPLASQALPPLVTHNESNAGDIFSLQNRWRNTFGEFQKVTIESFS